MKSAAGIHQSFDLEIRAVEYRADERVVIVQFRISRNDDPRPRLLSSSNGCKEQEGRQFHHLELEVINRDHC